MSFFFALAKQREGIHQKTPEENGPTVSCKIKWEVCFIQCKQFKMYQNI